MNLLTDSWIPVIRKNGECEDISPLSLLEDSSENPVVSVNTVRPDFDGAVLQFLIGIYQILLSPEDEFEWKKYLGSPPARKTLSEKIELIRPAFNFDEGEFRFMQDKGVIDTDVWELPKLLIEINNTHFVKDGTIQHLCPRCAALALLTLELNSPSGGRGHMTSLRGGGPLTTLLTLPSGQVTLWNTIVLNILPEENFGDVDVSVTSENLTKIFPWLSLMPNSEKNEVIVPKDMHPYHVFWNVPRRIYLDSTSTESGVCDVCGTETNNLLSKYWSRPNGIKYDSWTHPLTPYYLKKSKDESMFLPIRGHEGGVTYFDWIGIVLSSNDNSNIAAQNIRQNLSKLYGDDTYSDLKIHAFGYAMDNAKARVWQDGTLPTILLSKEMKEKFALEAGRFISTAKDDLFTLILKIREGYCRNRDSLKGSFSDVSADFWAESESVFYSALKELPQAINEDTAKGDENNTSVNAVKIQWVNEMRNICIHLFRERVSVPFAGEANPSQVVLAQDQLQFLLSTSNPKLCKSLGLPVPEKKKKNKVKS